MIRERLRAFSHQQFLINLLETIMLGLTLSIITGLVLIIYLKPYLWAGLVFFLPFLFLKKPSLLDLARYLEQREPMLTNRLVIGYQLSLLPVDSKEMYSREFIEAIIREGEAVLEKVNPRSHLIRTGLRQKFLMLIVSFAMMLGYACLQPGRFYYGITHQIEIEPFSIQGEFIRGSDVELGVSVSGPYLPEEIKLEMVDHTGQRRINLPLKNGVAQKKIKVENSFAYRFLILDRSTPFLKIDLAEPITLKNFTITYNFPPYTGLPPQKNSLKEIVAIKGTRVQIDGETSKSIETGFFCLESESLKISCRDNTFHTEFVVKNNGHGHLLLEARDRLIEEIPIVCLPDLPPLIEITYPPTTIDLPVNMTVPLNLRAIDDFGLSRIELVYQLKNKMGTILLAQLKGVYEETLSYDWRLADLNLLPGDEISYYIRVWDNDGYSGNKFSQSENMYIRFPTVEQIYREVADQESSLLSNFRILDKQQQELSQDLKKIENKLLRDKKIDWAEQKKLQAVIKEQQELLTRAEAWTEEVERTIKKINEGLITDETAIKRLREIESLIREIAPGEYEELLNRLQEKINRDSKDLARAIRELHLSQEEIKKRLERTVEVLKLLRHEEKLNNLARKAEELLKEQKAINDKKTWEEKARSQSDVKEGLDEIKNEMKGLTNDQLLEAEFRSELEQLLKEIEEQRMSERAGEMVQDYKNKKSTSESKLKNQELIKDLEGLKDNLDRLSKELKQKRRDQVTRNITRRISELLTISEEEENVALGKRANPAITQNNIRQAVENLSDSLFGLEKKSLFVGSEIGKRLGRSMESMDEAKNYFERGDNHLGKARASEALGYLNEAARRLINALQDVAQGGSSTGLEGLASALSSISFEQLMLNQALGGLLPLPIQGLTQGMKEQISQLASKQSQLRQSIEGLSQKVGDPTMREALNTLARSMKESEEELYQYKIDRDLIERQQKILYHLLDTQQSIRKQDTDMKRVAEPGRDFIDRPRPRALTPDLGERKRKLKEELIQALKTDYPVEYDRLIRAYFETLMQE